MKWISIKEKTPPTPGIIVAIMEGRIERGNDPIKDALIVILRSEYRSDEWRTMDCTQKYYLPEDGADSDVTIHYWLPWREFIFPYSMIVKPQEKDKE